MKDTFDLREFLTENKLTETGRKDNRYRFGKVILNEMVLKADEDIESAEDPVDEFVPDPEESIEEAGYTDDDFGGDGDLDFSAGDSLVNAIGGKKAKKAFDSSNDVDFDSEEPEPTGDVDSEDPEGDFEDPETMQEPAQTSANLANSLKYDPAGIQFEMDEAELDEFLNNFRRPQVAVKVLQRALDQAQSEVNEGYIKKLYLILDNGFYKTAAFRRGNVIAVVKKTK